MHLNDSFSQGIRIWVVEFYTRSFSTFLRQEEKAYVPVYEIFYNKQLDPP